MRVLLFLIYWAPTLFGAEVKQTLEPSDAQYIYDASVGMELQWLFRHLDSAGYKTPIVGEKFRFSDFFEVVHGSPKVFDLCYFTVDDKTLGALVRDVVEDKSVVVSYPLGNSLIAIMSVDLKDVDGFLRPSKLKGKKDTL